MTEAVSNAELAAFLDVTTGTIGDLAAKGRVVRIGRGKFDLKASTRTYIGHLRNAAAGRPATSEDLRAEKIRLTAAQADMAEMTKAERAEVMVSVKEFEDAWDHEILVLRQGLLGLADKIAMAHPHFTRHEVGTIDATIRLMLERVSDDADARLRRLDAADEQVRKTTRKSRRR